MQPTSRAGRAVVVALACLVLATPPAGAGQPRPSQVAGVPVPEGQIEKAVDRLDELAAGVLRRSGIPGLAVAVVKDGSTVYARGFGVRKVGHPELVDADTVFQVASVSKPVGATVVAHQVGEKVVAWDTPVSTLLPWFTLEDEWVGKHLTIGDLYAHRSGLPAFAGDDLEDLGYPRREVLERLRLLPLHPFRAHYAYTNFGLTAAAEAVAAASGTDWATLSETVLYRPLGMTATSSRFADFENRANRAHGHALAADGYRPLYQRQPDAQSPAGGVSSSVNDLAKWMAMVLQGGRYDGGQIVSPEALLPAISAQVISSGSPAADARAGAYGFGFNVSTQPSGRVTLGHSGAFALGAATAFQMIPSLNVGIVVLTNASPVGAPEALATEFTDLVQYGTIERDWLSAYASLMAPIMAPFGRLAGKPRPDSPVTAHDITSYLGRYRNAYFGEAVVGRNGNLLTITLGRDTTARVLQHWDGDVFTYEPPGENAPRGSVSAVTFDLGGDKRARTLVVEFLDGNGFGTFARIP